MTTLTTSISREKEKARTSEQNKSVRLADSMRTSTVRKDPKQARIFLSKLSMYDKNGKLVR